MNFRVTQAEGKRYVCGEDLAAVVACTDHPFRLDVLLDQVSFEPDSREDVDGNVWLEVNHMHKLFDWYKASAPAEHLPRIGGLLRAIKIEQTGKRKHARKHRWLVAYRQNYACFDCKQLLHPDAWECDHHVELRDGGTDSFSGVEKNNQGCWGDNLRALCSTCHSKKTRKRTREGASTKNTPTKNKFSKYFAHA